MICRIQLVQTLVTMELVAHQNHLLYHAVAKIMDNISPPIDTDLIMAKSVLSLGLFIYRYTARAIFSVVSLGIGHLC